MEEKSEQLIIISNQSVIIGALAALLATSPENDEIIEQLHSVTESNKAYIQKMMGWQ